jgi:sodium pump decarboxylase gamma subunit
MGELYWLWMMLIGMAVVVIGLLILIYSVRLMIKLSSDSKRYAGHSAMPDNTHLSLSYSPAAIGSICSADAAAVAAISAALMCYARDEGQLIIRSVRRAVNSGNVWDRAGRVEQFNRRM